VSVSAGTFPEVCSMGKKNSFKRSREEKTQPAGEPVEEAEDRVARLREAIQVLAVNRCAVQVEGRDPISSEELRAAGKEWGGNGVVRRVDDSTWEWDPQWNGGVVHVGQNGTSVEVPSYSPELAAERASLLVVAASLALGIAPAEAKKLPPASGFLRRAAEMKAKGKGGQKGSAVAQAVAKSAPSKFPVGKSAPKAPAKAGTKVMQPASKKPKTTSSDPVLGSTRFEHKQLQSKLNREHFVGVEYVTAMVTRLTKQVNACLAATTTPVDKTAARQLLTKLLGLLGQCRNPNKHDVVATNVVNSLGAWIAEQDQNKAPGLKESIAAAARAAVAATKAGKATAGKPAGKPVAKAAKAKWQATKTAPAAPKAGVAAVPKSGRASGKLFEAWQIPVKKPAHKHQPAKPHGFSPVWPKQPGSGKAGMVAAKPAHFGKAYGKAPASFGKAAGNAPVAKVSKWPAKTVQLAHATPKSGKPAQPAQPWQKGVGKGKGAFQVAPSAPLLGKGKGYGKAPAPGFVRTPSAPVMMKGAGKGGGKSFRQMGGAHAPAASFGAKGKGRGGVDVGQFFMNR